MKNKMRLAFLGLFAFGFLLFATAQKTADSTKVPAAKDTTMTVGNDSLTADSAMALIDADLAGPDEMTEGGGLHKQLKRKFLEGSASFMSLVALALVLGLAYIKKYNLNWVIYTDSVTALAWVREKRCKTKIEWNAQNQDLFHMIRKAEMWLHDNTWTTPIYKWDTKAWGEIPADFGRK